LIQIWAGKVVAQHFIVAEVGNRQGGIRGAPESSGEFCRFNPPEEDDAGARRANGAAQVQPLDDWTIPSQGQKGIRPQMRERNNGWRVERRHGYRARLSLPDLVERQTAKRIATIAKLARSWKSALICLNIENVVFKRLRRVLS